MKTQGKSKRTSTGSIYHARRKKRKYEMGREILRTKLGEKEVMKKMNCRGGNKKFRLTVTRTANVFDPKTKKISKAKVTNVIENQADTHFVRRNIITKGAIIETEKGKAKVTSRPSQDGTLNATLI